MSLNRRRLALTAVAALVGLVAAGIAGAGWFAHRPPEEVRTLDAVLQRLSQGNDLGQQPLAFMVGSGVYTQG